jgi:hypothetical protein
MPTDPSKGRARALPDHEAPYGPRRGPHVGGSGGTGNPATTAASGSGGVKARGSGGTGRAVGGTSVPRRPGRPVAQVVPASGPPKAAGSVGVTTTKRLGAPTARGGGRGRDVGKPPVTTPLHSKDAKTSTRKPVRSTAQGTVKTGSGSRRVQTVAKGRPSGGSQRTKPPPLSEPKKKEKKEREKARLRKNVGSFLPTQCRCMPSHSCWCTACAQCRTMTTDACGAPFVIHLVLSTHAPSAPNWRLTS